MFRPAETRDLEAVANIYNQAIQPGVQVTAEVRQVSVENRRVWLEKFRPPFGAWVLEERDGRIAGWASLGPFAVRPRLPGIAEISVYVEHSRRNGRVGAKLLACAVDEARQAGFRSIVSIASDRNSASIGGCIAYGFQFMGTLREVGRLGGRLEHAVWLQKNLLVNDPARFHKLRDSFLRSGSRSGPEGKE